MRPLALADRGPTGHLQRLAAAGAAAELIDPAGLGGHWWLLQPAGLAEDIEWHEAEGMPYGGVHRGRDAIAQNVLGPLLADIPDFALAPEEFLASGDKVAVVVRYTGTGKETGKPLDLRVVHVWDVREGQAARFRQFADTVKFGDVVPAKSG